MIRWLEGFLAAALLGMTLLAQNAAAPELKEVDRLKLQNIAQRIELAQLRAREAEREFAAAREELTKLVMGLKLDGYTLDLQSLTYVKEPPKTEAPPPPIKK